VAVMSLTGTAPIDAAPEADPPGSYDLKRTG
jgi:hypothetical protein